MQSDEVPDDIWINIIEIVDDPVQLAVLVRTCHRFRRLGIKLLLQDLRWVETESTAHNIEAWKGKYKDMLKLPRKLTLSVAFDFSAQEAWVAPTPEMALHDAIYAQILAFKSLHEIVLDGTVVSHYTHTVLGLIPTLRVLTIVNCKFIDLQTPFAQYNPNFISVDSQISPISITHLSLHKLILPDPDLNSNHMKYNHFLQFSNISTLTSLSLTWNQEVDIALTMFLQNFLDDEETWLFPNLDHLDIVIPVLSRFVDLRTLAWFVKNHCPLKPHIRLSIESHTLSEQQISSLRVGMRGMWSYNGPLCLLFRFRILTDLTHLIMRETMEFNNVLDELKKLPQTLQSLEIKIVEWDVEVLSAIRFLFPTIRSLIVRYARGTLPDDSDDRFIVTLGTEILFNLPHLHTLKLLHDISCLETIAKTPGPHNGQHFTSSSDSGHDNYHTSELRPGPAFDHNDLKDYLNAWNRYCKELRHLQLAEDSWWVRRFDGDQWVKMVCI